MYEINLHIFHSPVPMKTSRSYIKQR